MNPKYMWFGIALLIGLPADQITKYSIIDRLHYGEVVTVIPGWFDLTHVRNPGGAFSFFSEGPAEWRMAFFLGTGVIALILLLVFLRRYAPNDRLSPMALGMIFAGAVGNLTDRLVHGEVIDFLNVHLWAGYTWPTFNVADSLIVVGVIVLILEIFVANDQESTSGEQATENVN